jgi:hypothetical protein
MAEKIQKTVEVSKEASELLEGLKKFIVAMKDALADGWQVGKDLPVVLTSALGDLAPSLQGVEQIPQEAKDSKEFAAAVSLGLNDIVHALKK